MALYCFNCGEKFSVTDPKFCPICGIDLSQNNAGSGVPFAPASAGPENFYPYTWNFQSVTPEGFSEGVFTFKHSNLIMVDSQAIHWIDDDSLTEREILDAAGSTDSTNSDEERIHRAFTHLNTPLDGFEPIRWEDSILGGRFTRILKDLGVSFDPMPFGARVSYTDDSGRVVEDFIKEPIDLIAGKWATTDGQPFLEMGRIYRNSQTGEEKIYWHIEALVRTRYPLSNRSPHMSKLVRIPSMLQNIFYVCETQFPSSLVTMPRSMAYNVGFEEIGILPKPFIQIEENVRACYLEKENHETVRTYFAPELTRIGYIIGDNYSDEELRKYIPTMFDTLMKIPNVLLDGFANYGAESEVPFQARLGADGAFPEEDSYDECGFVVPALIYGALCDRSEVEYRRVYGELRNAIASGNDDLLSVVLDDLILIVSLCAGEIFGHAVNTLAFTVIQYRSSASEAFAAMLENASRYPVDFQDVNALSNLAMFHLKMGQVNDAERVIDRALLRIDSGFEAIVNQTNSMTWDSSDEVTIVEEIFLSYFQIKSDLGRKSDCDATLPKALEFLKKHPELTELAQVVNSF